MKKIFLITMLMCFAYSVSAQKNNEKTGALLWKISGNGLKQPSYIFGTHHLFPLTFLDSVAGVKKAFYSCNQMVGELIMDDMNALAAETQKAGMMPQDTTWQMLLSDEDYNFVDEQLTAIFGAGIQAFGVLKPAMVNMIYAVSFFQKTFPEVKQDEVFDIWFQQQAVKKGVAVIGLETVQDQTKALFESVSLQQQANGLVCTLKNPESMELNAKKLNSLYRAADLKSFSKMLHEDDICPYSTEEQIALIDMRNKKWLQKLPAIMAGKSSFIAVGCMHLVGETGLLIGLERLGYTVKAVVK